MPNDAAASLFDPHEGFLAASLATDPHDHDMTARRCQFAGYALHTCGLGVLSVLPRHQQTKPPREQHDAMAGGLVLSSGIHGNETAPIELLDALVDALLTGEMTVTRPTLLIMGHPQAMQQQTRFVQHNMNRLFCGQHTQDEYIGSPDAFRAAQLERALATFHDQHPITLHLDLHTAIRPSHIERFALMPYQPDVRCSDTGLRALQAMRVGARIQQHQPSTTFSAHSARTYGAESYTVELGQVKPFGQNDLSHFADVASTLRALLAWQPESDPAPVPDAPPIPAYRVCHEIIHSGETFELLVDQDCPNFTAFSRDALLWRSDQHAYRVQHDTEWLLFPNAQVPAGQRAGLMICRQNA